MHISVATKKTFGSTIASISTILGFPTGCYALTLNSAISHVSKIGLDNVSPSKAAAESANCGSVVTLRMYCTNVGTEVTCQKKYVNFIQHMHAYIQIVVIRNLLAFQGRLHIGGDIYEVTGQRQNPHPTNAQTGGSKGIQQQRQRVMGAHRSNRRGLRLADFLKAIFLSIRATPELRAEIIA